MVSISASAQPATNQHVCEEGLGSLQLAIWPSLMMVYLELLLLVCSHMFVLDACAA